MFSKNNPFLDIITQARRKRELKKREREYNKSFHVEDLILDGNVKVIGKNSPEYPVSLFDNVMRIVIKKVCKKEIKKHAFSKFFRHNYRYFDLHESRKIENYLAKYFQNRGNFLSRFNATYEKLDKAFDSLIPYVQGGIYSYDVFYNEGIRYLGKLNLAKKKKNNKTNDSDTKVEISKQLPLPTLDNERSNSEVDSKNKPSVPVFAKKTSIQEIDKNIKKEVKSKKEVTNLDLVYKQYRKVLNKIKKLYIELESEVSFEKYDFKHNQLLSYIELSKQFENIIYNYKKLDKNYADSINNSFEIRRQNALNSINRYLNSKKNSVTLDNFEEHFGQQQISYFKELGINIEEIIINTNQNKKRKNK